MGDMADMLNEQMERGAWEREDDPEDAYAEFIGRISDPFMWTRSDGTIKNIKDLNAYHLGNVLQYIEKNLNGYTGPMPPVYFNLMNEARKKGVGLTDLQIGKLIEKATEKKPVLFAAFDKKMDYERYPGTILNLEEDEDEVSLVVCDGDGAQLHKILSFLKDGKIHLHGELPIDSKIKRTDGGWPEIVKTNG